MSLKNSTFEVVKSPFHKKDIFIPTSKSYANRLLILASVFPGSITLNKLPESTDVLTMIECLKKLGLTITGDLNSLKVENSFPESEANLMEQTIHLQTGDGGTTNRFLMGLVSLGQKKYVFHPTERISERPVDQFINELESFNVQVTKENDAWLSFQGPAKFEDDKIEIDCSKSTQFATSIQLIISPLKKKVLPINLHSSAGYFDITNNLCEQFIHGERKHTVPLDFSSFGYPVALAAVEGKLELTDFTGLDSYQADSEIISVLNKMGAQVKINGKQLEVNKSQLNSIQVDCSNFPDLVPTLAYLCSYAKGVSQLQNISVLRDKESDRILETLKILKAFEVSAKYNEDEDFLEIEGRESLEKSIELETARDHRMIMVAYLFMRTNGGGKLHHVNHINKSYPHFLESFA